MLYRPIVHEFGGAAQSMGEALDAMKQHLGLGQSATAEEVADMYIEIDAENIAAARRLKELQRCALAWLSVPALTHPVPALGASAVAFSCTSLENFFKINVGNFG